MTGKQWLLSVLDQMTPPPVPSRYRHPSLRPSSPPKVPPKKRSDKAQMLRKDGEDTRQSA